MDELAASKEKSSNEELKKLTGFDFFSVCLISLFLKSLYQLHSSAKMGLNLDLINLTRIWSLL